MNANEIVGKLWRLCAILRKDGITYQQYVTELTFLLFLKMMQELDREDEKRDGKKLVSIPVGHRWSDLAGADGAPQLSLYKQILNVLGDQSLHVDRRGKLVYPPASPSHDTSEEQERTYQDKLSAYERAEPLPRTVQAIFANSSTFFRQPANLKELVDQIDRLQWFSTERDHFGDLYEGLLQKNAEETKRGAGQYFTPRVLIEMIVGLIKPQPGEIIQDPAAGTGGFLIQADHYIREHTNNHRNLKGTKDQDFQRVSAFHGMENVSDTYRLLLMNLYLHGIDPDHVVLGDALSSVGAAMQRADLILSNPPFGPAGGKPTRDDLTATKPVSSYQLPFVEHCIRNLKVGGRAAIIVPDNVLSENDRGGELRRMMMRWCKVHTILRLPTGIFYAQGVKTNVIFLQKCANGDLASSAAKEDETSEVWVYDLRSGMPQLGKTNPLRSHHLQDFIKAYGDDPNGRAPRKDQGSEGRFRHFTRAEIAARGDRLDATWLSHTDETSDQQIAELDDIASAILGHLEKAAAEIRSLQNELFAEGSSS